MAAGQPVNFLTMKRLNKDLLEIQIYPSRPEMGTAAAAQAVEYIRQQLTVKPTLNIVFAAAPSQNEFLAAMAAADIDWGRINAFHMDEYIGLGPDAPQGFGNFLRLAIFDRVPFKEVFYLAGKDCGEYARLLENYPTDIVFMGIGENGHIAFNDPHVAFFDDPARVKPVELDEKCRRQQVNDGCFAALDDVPTHAVTLTIPALMAAPRIFCIVPAPTKAEAVRNTIEGPVAEACPASVLRRHRSATLYLDADSSALLTL